jgi:hypothetical protein
MMSLHEWFIFEISSLEDQPTDCIDKLKENPVEKCQAWWSNKVANIKRKYFRHEGIDSLKKHQSRSVSTETENETRWRPRRIISRLTLHPNCQESLGQDQSFSLLRLSPHIVTNTFWDHTFKNWAEHILL